MKVDAISTSTVDMMQCHGQATSSNVVRFRERNYVCAKASVWMCYTAQYFVCGVGLKK